MDRPRVLTSGMLTGADHPVRQCGGRKDTSIPGRGNRIGRRFVGAPVAIAFRERQRAVIGACWPRAGARLRMWGLHCNRIRNRPGRENRGAESPGRTCGSRQCKVAEPTADGRVARASRRIKDGVESDFRVLQVTGRRCHRGGLALNSAASQ